MIAGPSKASCPDKIETASPVSGGGYGLVDWKSGHPGQPGYVLALDNFSASRVVSRSVLRWRSTMSRKANSLR